MFKKLILATALVAASASAFAAGVTYKLDPSHTMVLASWIRVEPLADDWLQRVCAPLLKPLQRVMPPLGNVDLTPLVWTLGAQMFSRSLEHWQDQWLQRTLML